jgi:hypothetical protein
LAVSANGPIPAGGVVVNVVSDVDFSRTFNNNGRPPTTFGGQILGAIFNAAGEPIGFQLRLDSPNATITLPVRNNALLPNELQFRPTFRIAPGDGYNVSTAAGAAQVRVVNDLASAPVVATPPEVSLTATNTTLVESEGGSVTLNFRLSSPPPADGVIVKVTGDAGGVLGEFDVLNITATGGSFPASVGSTGFFFRITSQEASLTVPIFPDGDEEGLEAFRFTVQPGFGYTVSPTANSTLVTIKDTPATVLPFVSLTGSPTTLIEAAETVSRHTFTLSAPPPAEGFLVAVAAPNIGEFNLSRISVTGGEIAGLTPDGFNLRMTARTAVISLPVLNDGVAEGQETAVFTLKPAANYTINPAASTAQFNIFDVALPRTGETESNDSLERANVLTLGASGSTTTIRGAIDYNGSNTYRARPTDTGNTVVDNTEDVDLYKVTLRAGDRLAIDIDAEQTLASTLDAAVQVFDATGRRLAASDDDPAPNEIFLARRDSYLDFTAPADGDYYIGVSAFANLESAQSYDPTKPGSGVGRSTGTYDLNLTLNGSLPAPTPPVAPPSTITGPRVSLSTIAGTYDAASRNEVITAQGLAEDVPAGGSVLSIVLKADGPIPEGGVEVVINSDKVLRQYFSGLNGTPFAIGGRVVGAVYDPNTGEATGIRFNMVERNALFNLLTADNEVADGPRQVNFSLGAGNYTIDAAANASTITIYDTLAQIPQASQVPEVSLSIANSALVESVGNEATLTLRANGPIPAEGLVVYVDSGSARVLGQLDVLNATVTGGVFPAGNFRTSGFYFKMTEPTATISIRAFDDGEVEGLQDYTFQVVPGAGYTASATQNSAKFTIGDDPSTNKLQVTYTGTPGSATAPGTLVEEAGTVSVHTFALNATPPAGGVTIFVKSDNLNEFDLTKAEITGGSLVGVTAGGFNLNITSRTAVVRVPVKNDGIAEGPETAVFTVEPGSTYLVNPTANRVTYNLVDQNTVETEGTTLTTINDVISQAVDTRLSAGKTNFRIQGTIGNAARNFIDASEDVDLYKVELNVGDRLLIDVDSVPFTITGNAVPQIVDTNIRLFDSTGRQVAISNDAAAPDEFYSANRDPFLSYNVTTAGTYYVGIASGTNSFYDPTVAGSGGGRVTPADGRNIGRYDLAIDVQPFQKPEVGLRASTAVVNEAQGTVLTLTLNTTGTIPPEGLVVDLQGDVANLLAQFTNLQTRFNADGSLRQFITPNTIVSGGILGAVEPDLSSFKFTITKPTATIQLPVLNDLIEEADQTYRYSLRPSEAYSVNPAAASASFRVSDGVAGGVGPTIGFTAAPTALYESEQTAVTLTFNVTGTLPPEGVVVVLDGGIPRAVAEFDVTASNPRTPENNFVATGPVVSGGRIVGTNETASALLFRITEPTATITVPVFQDDETEGTETFTYRLLDGELYQVNPSASSATITIGDVKPVVSLSSSPSLISEAAGSVLTLTFTTTGDIPPEGVRVNLAGDVARIMQQFTAAQTRFNPDGSPLYRFDNAVANSAVGGVLDRFSLDADPNSPGFLSNFFFTITQPTATLTIPVLNDLIEEPDQTFTYTLLPGQGYSVNPAAASTSFRVTDGVPGGVGPTIGFTAAPTALYESEQTAVTLTFNVTGTLPPEGVVVVLDGGIPRAVAEFDVTASNPRTPENNFVATGPVVSGGRIVGTNEIASALLFRITEPTATITVPVFQDDETEGTETFTYRLLDGELYQVDANASSATITIEDVRPRDEVFFGDSSNNAVTFGNGNNTVFAGEGNNTVTTGSGNDSIYAGAGNDVINAGSGRNTVFAGEGNNSITTGAGNDVVYAGAGNDVISTGAGDDLIYAGEGSNRIDAGTGNDQVFSGSGADVFTLNRGAGFVTINTFQADLDKFALGTGLAASDLTLTRSGNDTIVSAGSDQLAVLKFTQVDRIQLA